jgi:type IV pilus assembly protein PilY1
MELFNKKTAINISTLLIFAAVFSSSYADDTEIYGTNGAGDENKYAQPNVMIILDTSGSMQGEASYVVKEAYNNATTYTGDYSRILPNLNYYKTWGYTEDRLKNNASGCADELAKLDTVGTVTAKFREWDPDSGTWVALTSGNNNNQWIQCTDDGWEYTLYSPNYVKWFHTNNKVEQVTTRMKVVQDAIVNLVNNLEDVNVGLMRFDQGSEGGLVDVAIGTIETVKESIITKVNTYTPYGGTPLTEVLYEAGQYYHGQAATYGADAEPNNSVSASMSDGSYISPISAQCQKNNIILFTDGEPSGDDDVNETVANNIAAMGIPTAVGIDNSCSSTSSHGTCLDELAYYLANKDASTTYLNDQLVSTYTIGGFGLSSAVELLSKTALRGQNGKDGGYYAADNAEDLALVLAEIFESILATNTTFTAPAVSVNAFNASENRDELFYALFRPSDKTDWAGNLKKYKLNADGLLLDQLGNAAIDPDTGYFAPAAVGFWNETSPTVADGGIVDVGGFAGKLSSARNIFTDKGVDQVGGANTATALVSLDASGATSKELLGLDSTATAEEFNQLKNWVKGQDAADIDGDDDLTESRKSIGDPLHSEPLVHTYGGTSTNPDSTIFFGTNQGFIHAVNANTGVEVFSYIPKEMQANQKTYFDNNLAAANRPYGMDGLISSWTKDLNSDGVIFNPDGSLQGGTTAESKEHFYIYAGMRRGGRNYYALDVTYRNAPKLLFKIKGGPGGTTGFEKLGQTWGPMTIAKVMFKGTQRQVAFIPGGYDTDQDVNATRMDDNEGNVIYMVDATTGELLWTASNSNANTIIADMDNSIPAGISAMDINGDGNVNYFYAADTGGRILRFDINQENESADQFANGGVIADLAGGDTANNRRFYSKPSVSIIRDKQNADYLTIALGSGHRAAPISNKAVQDRFYMIKDFNIKPRATASFNLTAKNDTSFYDAYKRTEASPIVSSGTPDAKKVYNASSLITGAEPSNSMKDLMNKGAGWYINLSSVGEKSFTRAITTGSAILFTTFSPSGVTLGCGADTGIARLYALDQRWASPVMDLNNDGNIDEKDGSKVLAHSGIAPRPVVIYRPGGERSIAIGTETIKDSRYGSPGPPPPPGCEDTPQGCPVPPAPSKCETNNCYVVPVYWRQND